MAKTLLLADDSVTIQKVVSISFASEDVTLVTVDNGDDAIERAREARPDLVLADVVMPGKSGYEVCEAIKADPELRHVPVLLLSGTFEAFDEARAAAVGADGHIAKPFEAQSLVDRVNAMLSSAPAPAASEPASAAPPATPEPIEMPGDDAAADSFDFFDDDLGPDPLDESDPVRRPEALDLSDDALGMSDDDLTPAEMPADPPSDAGFVGAGEIYPDRTLALVPEEDGDAAEVPPTAVATDLDALGDDDELVATVEEDDSFVTADPASTADEAFDFAFESESTAPESLRSPPPSVQDSEVDALVDGAALGPAAAMPGGAPPSGADLADATRVVDIAPESVGVEQPIEVEAVETTAAPEPAGFEMPEIESSGPIEREPAADAAPAVEPEPVAPAASGDAGDAAARVDALLAEISPGLREALHDTLEKMAWEAFGDVTDKIVSDVVDRVEKVAWEVVPQLTETLIKAEIQRLKSEPDD